MERVAHLDSDASKYSKKNETSPQKKHILLRFERWNFIHSINMM